MSNKMDESYKIRKKKLKHNPQAESVKSVFGEPKARDNDPSDFKI
ncbi:MULTISPECIES: CPC_1213 family protein [Clostridium]|nr:MULTISPECIES: CPC_1213 family protein [Clostridium]